MLRLSYVNGCYRRYNEALIHIEDRGYQFSDGIYEVWSVQNGQLKDKEEHFERLYASLKKIELQVSILKPALNLIIDTLIKKNRVLYGMVYLQITRGVISRDHKFPIKKIRPSLVITTKNFPKRRFDPDEVPVFNIVTTCDLRWKRCDIKSIGLLANIMAKEYAYKRNAQECWFVDKNGWITEGSSTTAWIVSKGVLKTHPLSSCILPGVTREKIIHHIRSLNLTFMETPFSLEEAEQADEAFLSSATLGIAAVISINNKKINNRNIGEITMQLRKAYFNLFS